MSFLTLIKPRPSYPRHRRTAIGEGSVRHGVREEVKKVRPGAKAENDADGCASFAAIERSMLDRLLAQALTAYQRYVIPTALANRLGAF
jgi:hypothetical protein